MSPEPSHPEEREAHHLPPKSYAEAAENGANDEFMKVNGGPVLNTDSTDSLNSEPSHPDEREAHDLPPKSYAEAAENGIYIAKDEKIKTAGGPTVNGTYKQRPATLEQKYSGSGQDDFPRSPVRKSPRRSSLRHNGIATKPNPKNENNLIFEKYKDSDGDQLTSIKPLDEYENEVRQGQLERRDAGEREILVSGRKAGAGWERSGIRWAPLNVPLKRRLQTLVVLMHTLSIASLLTLFFFLSAIPLLWPILFPYLIYVLLSNAGTSGQLSHRWERARRSPIWSLFASYFPARLHRSHELPSTRKYIFGYHPHGIISHGAFAAFGTEALGFSQLFPGIINTLLTLDSNFRIPLYRDYALRMGLASVSRESCENILSQGGPNGEGMGRAITIVVGGARESLDAQPGTLRLVLAKRKGFIKLAIRTGADLVPVLAFGENELYEQFNGQEHPWVHRAQLLIKKVMGFTVPLFHARGVFNYDVGMMPYRRPMNIVVGKPIKVIQQEEPDSRYVDEIHAEYMKELRWIWDEWKDTFAKHRTSEMEIVE
ncbi:DAGAT-domain-containing protein [Patellaria atrata CBS 101060]|uniref:diacylglycerol O-acyltransferase n=1 Tax=Patellaria atrata CBS 101060 TaxID=1346257 RepID=A0A9P4SJT2_9PEZI|nr:DAGAT-domain-containing protein [Patellaria atrata CBS 101060]